MENSTIKPERVNVSPLLQPDSMQKMSSNDFLTYFSFQNIQPNNLSSNFSLDKIVALITNTNSSDNSSWGRKKSIFVCRENCKDTIFII